MTIKFVHNFGNKTIGEIIIVPKDLGTHLINRNIAIAITQTKEVNKKKIKNK